MSDFIEVKLLQGFTFPAGVFLSGNGSLVKRNTVDFGNCMHKTTGQEFFKCGSKLKAFDSDLKLVDYVTVDEKENNEREYRNGETVLVVPDRFGMIKRAVKCVIYSVSLGFHSGACLTGSGAPKVGQVEKLLGFDITAGERTAAFEAI